MTSAVDGVIKIGKTETGQFQGRMRFLESNGYKNITGLKRVFAIEVNEYDEKEKMVHDIFGKSRIANSECFAVNKDLVIQLLSSFEGDKIFPEDETKEEIFDKATKNYIQSNDTSVIIQLDDNDHDLLLYLKNNRGAKATGVFRNRKMVVKKNSRISDDVCTSFENHHYFTLRKNLIRGGIILNKIFNRDFEFDSPSAASAVVLGRSSNGLDDWKTRDGRKLKDIIV